MATSSSTRTGAYIQALPTSAQAAEILGVSPSWVTRAVKTLGIEPVAWGRKEKHLAVADVLRLGEYAKRTALEAVGGALLDFAEQRYPDEAEEIRAEIDAFFADRSLPEPTAADEFVAFLHEALPPAYAEVAVERYLAGPRSTQ